MVEEYIKIGFVIFTGIFAISAIGWCILQVMSPWLIKRRLKEGIKNLGKPIAKIRIKLICKKTSFEGNYDETMRDIEMYGDAIRSAKALFLQGEWNISDRGYFLSKNELSGDMILEMENKSLYNIFVDVSEGFNVADLVRLKKYKDSGDEKFNNVRGVHFHMKIFGEKDPGVHYIAWDFKEKKFYFSDLRSDHECLDSMKNGLKTMEKVLDKVVG